MTSKYIYIVLTYFLLIFLVFDKYYPGSIRRDVPTEGEEGGRSTEIVDGTAQLLDSAVVNGGFSTVVPVLDPLAEFKSEYNINGTDRFEWYREQMFLKLNISETKTAHNISTLYAYEFEHEIAITTTSWRRIGHKMFCRYLDENNKEIGKPYESFTYPEYIVYCQKREGVKKIGLSVKWDPRGVQHFYLHIHNASNYDLKVINDYVRTGEVEVHYLLERDQRTDNHWHMVNIADCLIWSRGDSKWTIFADLDERIIMTNYTGTILDYLREIRNESVAGIQFRQQWVLKTELMPETYQGDLQIDAWMPTHRFHNSTGIGPELHTTKCIIDSTKVFDMWVHDVTEFFPGKGYFMKRLSPEEGLVRHYRDQSLGEWGKKWLNKTLRFGPLRKTDYPEKYRGKLTENVKRRAKYVYGNKYD
ncbi:hypothetical protein CAEBREN_28756 [Caenorhabditis brenneri]|uniref:Glycosyltransferase family 92 protein n=1 Tax=Caenorhabditis brenneri TaxID=135651 RepID=G0MTL8_CAEBE|nr:hypothetical protein CAEBREN_28756 [Caenorhabditis brenneri]